MLFALCKFRLFIVVNEIFFFIFFIKLFYKTGLYYLWEGYCYLFIIEYFLHITCRWLGIKSYMWLLYMTYCSNDSLQTNVVIYEYYCWYLWMRVKLLWRWSNLGWWSNLCMIRSDIRQWWDLWPWSWVLVRGLPTLKIFRF